jgi:uncharacterized protein YceK
MKTLLIGAMCLSLSACASIVSGTTQKIGVNTSVPGARCTLENAKGSWDVSKTPGSVTVEKARSPLDIECHKSGMRGHAVIDSSTEGMAFGNVVFGGLIGGGVDMATGAAYRYPVSVNVDMK